MPRRAVAVAAASACLLGEGPVWDAPRGRLWWLDILRSQVLWHAPANGAMEARDAPARLTALAPTADGRFAACGDGGFGLFDPEGWTFSPITQIEGEAEGTRFNDGKADARGRFWAGTMERQGAEPVGRLHRFDPDGRTTCVAAGFQVPNGPAFDGAGRMHLADSSRRVIRRYPAERPGEADCAEVFAHFERDQGYPDGMSFDDEDHLWVAFWDGGCVRRLSPGGTVVAEIPLPVSRPTSCAFGGPDRATLFVTSARVDLDADALAAQPLAGALLAVRPGVSGPAPARFGEARSFAP